MFLLLNFIPRFPVLLSDSQIVSCVRNMAALRVFGLYKGYTYKMVDNFGFCSQIDGGMFDVGYKGIGGIGKLGGFGYGGIKMGKIMGIPYGHMGGFHSSAILRSPNPKALESSMVGSTNPSEDEGMVGAVNHNAQHHQQQHHEHAHHNHGQSKGNPMHKHNPNVGYAMEEQQVMQQDPAVGFAMEEQQMMQQDPNVGYAMEEQKMMQQDPAVGYALETHQRMQQHPAVGYANQEAQMAQQEPSVSYSVLDEETFQREMMQQQKEHRERMAGAQHDAPPQQPPMMQRQDHHERMTGFRQDAPPQPPSMMSQEELQFSAEHEQMMGVAPDGSLLPHGGDAQRLVEPEKSQNKKEEPQHIHEKEPPQHFHEKEPIQHYHEKEPLHHYHEKEIPHYYDQEYHYHQEAQPNHHVSVSCKFIYSNRTYR